MTAAMHMNPCPYLPNPSSGSLDNHQPYAPNWATDPYPEIALEDPVGEYINGFSPDESIESFSPDSCDSYSNLNPNSPLELALAAPLTPPHSPDLQEGASNLQASYPISQFNYGRVASRHLVSPTTMEVAAGFRARKIPVKLLYTFDKARAQKCLAKPAEPLTVHLDARQTIAMVDLSVCIEQVLHVSPELADLTHVSDYSVYSVDYSEKELPLLAHGKLSPYIGAYERKAIGPARQFVSGRLCSTALCARMVEVQLHFTPLALKRTFSQAALPEMEAMTPSSSSASLPSSHGPHPSSHAPHGHAAHAHSIHVPGTPAFVHTSAPMHAAHPQSSHTPMAHPMAQAGVIPASEPSSISLKRTGNRRAQFIPPSSPPAPRTGYRNELHNIRRIPPKARFTSLNLNPPSSPPRAVPAYHSNTCADLPQRSISPAVKSATISVNPPTYADLTGTPADEESQDSRSEHETSDARSEYQAEYQSEFQSEQAELHTDLGSELQTDLRSDLPESENRPDINSRRRARIDQRLFKAVCNGDVPTFCENCGAIHTSSWRRVTANNKQMILCNACGLFHKKNGMMRPHKLWDRKARVCKPAGRGNSAEPSPMERPLDRPIDRPIERPERPSSADSTSSASSERYRDPATVPTFANSPDTPADQAEIVGAAPQPAPQQTMSPPSPQDSARALTPSALKPSALEGTLEPGVLEPLTLSQLNSRAGDKPETETALVVMSESNKENIPEAPRTPELSPKDGKNIPDDVERLLFSTPKRRPEVQSGSTQRWMSRFIHSRSDDDIFDTLLNSPSRVRGHVEFDIRVQGTYVADGLSSSPPLFTTLEDNWALDKE